jgi:hypothetical protein
MQESNGKKNGKRKRRVKVQEVKRKERLKGRPTEKNKGKKHGGAIRETA